MSQLGVLGSGNKVGNLQFIGIFACVKPCSIVGTQGHSEKFKIKNRICRMMVLDEKKVALENDQSGHISLN